jgi:zinc/manganese transport system substrate-binding protein
VVNAFDAAGAAASVNDKNRNEHIWYSVPQVAVAAVAIGSAVDQALTNEKVAGGAKLKLALQSSMTGFLERLDTRRAKLEAIKAAGTCGRVFASEPLIDYLLADAGCLNVTPVAYSRAIEEERDVPPAVLNQVKKILKNGVDFVALNSSVSSTQIDSLMSQVSANRGIYGFTELLEQDPDTLEYYGDYLTLLDDAIKTVEGKF